MSEYTNYCLVPGKPGVQEILRRLRGGGVCAVVDDSHQLPWVVVFAPPENRTVDGAFLSEPAFPKLAVLFEVVLELWEDEGPLPRWSLKAARPDGSAQVRSDATPDAQALTFVADAVGVAPMELRGLLRAGGMPELCTAIGAPYQQMNDQRRGDRAWLLAQGGAVHADDVMD